MIVKTETGPLLQDHVDVLETNVDDVTGEVIAYAIACCMEAGARDAGAIPMIMKKGRPGYLVRIICNHDRSTAIAEILARELGTLGIRESPMVHRFIAEREVRDVGVTIRGSRRKIPVKFGRLNDGSLFTVKPEFEAARAWADELGIPVRDVLLSATKAGWRSVTVRHEEHP
jgi:uncharacterized protein (DUF111 family)